MGAPEVENLLEKIKSLLFDEPSEILVAKEVVEMLENSIRLFKVFLEDNPHKFEGLDPEISYRETVRDIRKIVWETEDLIDSVVEGEDEIDYSDRDTDTRKALHGVAEEAESVGAKVVRMYDEIGTADIRNSLQIHFRPAPQPDLIKRKPLVEFQVKRDFVVGFKEEAEKFIGYLMQETEGIDIISIIGMPGLGKTTLAWKIFQDPTIQNEFPFRNWVNGSSVRTRRNLYLHIREQCSPKTCTSDQMYYTYKLLPPNLETDKSLIVMDDLRASRDLDNLISSLPSNIKMVKVLTTSRITYSIKSSQSMKLDFLSDRESWLLLRYEVFGHTNCPTELEDLGKLIAKQCNGLPLAIVVMGGVLAHQISSKEDMDSRRRGWIEVYERLRIISKDNSLSLLEEIVALSYDRLPYHLRACFLYLGMFPKGLDIPVMKLTLLWIAEGFIAPKEGISMEETAEKYLDELIGMNLVRIDKTTIDGKAKTCHIHDIVHGFCQHKIGSIRESIYEETKFSGRTTSRCLCMHSNFWDFISSNPCGAQIRSFMFFSKEENDSPSERERISSILTTFKQLRVLEAEKIEFSKLPSDLYRLVHLKYITLSLNSKILPSVLSNLRNVETLIVNTEFDTLEIKADIWSMTHLRHLKTNASASLPKIRKGNVESNKGGEKLQTLGRISPQSCKQEVFDRARWLKKLTIGGRLVILFSKSKTVSFDHLRQLHNLEKLKLNGWGDDKLPGLPPPHKFPPRLRSLTLSNTKIDWVHMHILGMLENLKVLELNYYAFKGEVWEVADDGFRHLEILKIEHTDLTKWVASEHHFPNLRRLELRKCYRLQEVPVQLAEIQTFQELGLYKCTYADISAWRIRDRKRRVSKANDFKLWIFPGDD